MIDEKIEKGGYIMTKPLGACKVKRRYISMSDKGVSTLCYEVTTSTKNDISFHVMESLCTRRATEQEFKR